MKVSETLNAAADIMAARGMGREWFPEPGCTGPVCVEGAISLAAGRRIKLRRKAKEVLRSYLTETRPDEPRSAYTGVVISWAWYDAPDRTLNEVVSVLRAAAAFSGAPVIEAAREDAARESAPQPAPALTEAVASS